MEHEAESLLSASLASLSKGRQKLFTHIGLWVSLLALLIAALATFTNISILSLSAETLTITVAIYAAVTVVIFFSLAEEGERMGRSEAAYQEAEKDLNAAASRVTPAQYASLESFCRRYAESAFSERRARLLLAHGITRAEDAPPKAAVRQLKRLRPLQLNAFMLLGKSADADSPLRNPERRRKNRLFLRLTPSLICTCFGIGIAIGVRDTLTLSAILEGIFKLSARLIVGLRGYMQGYLFIGTSEIPFIRAKARLLERFLSETKENTSATERESIY